MAQLRRLLAEHIFPLWGFNFDDICAHTAKEAGSPRAYSPPAKVQNVDSVK